jgi:endoglucanase
MLPPQKHPFGVGVVMWAALLFGCSSSSSFGSGGDAGVTNPDSGISNSDGGSTTGLGYLHTSGGQIVDAQNTPVRLTGVSWFGMETDWFAPHGLDKQSLSWHLDRMQQLGYNMVRIPFCTQMLDAGSSVKNIDYTKNPDLKGKSPIELLDKIIEQAGARKLRVILDRHRPDAYSQSDLWYTGQYSEQRWIDDWKLLGNPLQGQRNRGWI